MKVGTELNKVSAPTQAEDGRAIRAVAKEFEGLLMAEVMKAMRRTVPESGMSSDTGQQIFTGMLDGELSSAMSKGSGLGLADILATQLGAAPVAQAVTKPVLTDPELSRTLSAGTFVAPVAGPMPFVNTAQRFGAYRAGDRPRACGGGHCGVDLSRPEGTPVASIADGIVTKVGHDPETSTGLWVEVSHGDGQMASRYMHLSKIAGDLAPGDAVKAGENLGAVGNTGVASHGNHLHFEILRRSAEHHTRWADPAPYLSRWSAQPLAPSGASPVGPTTQGSRSAALRR